MLDIRLLRENPDLVKARLANRGGDHAALVDEVLSIDTARRSAETERQKLQGDRNRLSKEIGMGRKNGQDTSALEAEVKGINTRIEEIGQEADAADVQAKADTDGAAAASPEAPSEVVAVEDAPNADPESDDVAPLSDANPSGTDVSTAATDAAKDEEPQGEDEPKA